MEKTIRIGSRESRLAVIQSEIVRKYIREHGHRDAEIVTMKTTGDRILDQTLDKIGGKGLFVKELDAALMDGRSDLSVHSLKDMPAEIPAELPLLGFSRREDPRDVLVLPKGAERLDPSKPIGCSSKRRVLQAKKLYPDMAFAPVRGNVLTRLEKLDRGEYGALILAAAGLKRLGLENRISRYFETTEILPAAGQGILAIQGKAGENYDFLAGFFDEESAAAARCERAFVKELDGGCSSPIGAYAVVSEGHLHVTGLYYEENEADIYLIGSKEGATDEPEALGRTLAVELKAAFAANMKDREYQGKHDE
jgi:hydroxymethylbilane synthase